MKGNAWRILLMLNRIKTKKVPGNFFIAAAQNSKRNKKFQERFRKVVCNTPILKNLNETYPLRKFNA
jgi:hypothetical protein